MKYTLVIKNILKYFGNETLGHGIPSTDELISSTHEDVPASSGKFGRFIKYKILAYNKVILDPTQRFKELGNEKKCLPAVYLVAQDESPYKIVIEVKG